MSINANIQTTGISNIFFYIRGRIKTLLTVDELPLNINGLNFPRKGLVCLGTRVFVHSNFTGAVEDTFRLSNRNRRRSRSKGFHSRALRERVRKRSPTSNF